MLTSADVQLFLCTFFLSCDSESRLLPVLANFINRASSAGTTSAAAPLLSTFLTAPSEKANNDISTYVSALGFPSILEAAEWRFPPTYERRRERLEVCADMLDEVVSATGPTSRG